MTKKAKATSFLLSEEALQGLSELAEICGCVWGGKPSTSKFLEKLGRKEIPFSPNRPGVLTKEQFRLSMEKVTTFLENSIDL